MSPAQKESRIDLLLIVEGRIASVYILEGALRACREHGIDVRMKLSTELTASDFGPNTVPLLVRCGNHSIMPWVTAMQRSQRPYLYYLDDNFWAIPTDTALGRYYNSPFIQHALATTISCATAVLVHSEQLVPWVAQLNSNIKLVPPSFDFGIIADVKPEATDEIRIGFAGSTSKLTDLDLVSPIVRELLDLDPRVVLEFAGILPRGTPDHSRIRHFPYTSDYRSYLRFQRSRGWAIGLAPMQSTESNRCKTDNKYREYGACEIAGIYSRTLPYVGSVMDGVTGILAGDDPGEWLAAIKTLISKPERRVGVGMKAFADVYRRYRVEVAAAAWVPHVREIAAQGSVAPLRLSLMRTLPVPKAFDRMRTFAIQVGAVYQAGGVNEVVRSARRRLRDGP